MVVAECLGQGLVTQTAILTAVNACLSVSITVMMLFLLVIQPVSIRVGHVCVECINVWLWVNCIHLLACYCNAASVAIFLMRGGLQS